MGKNIEQKHGDGIPTDKSNPNRKWIKMLNVLDYHRWNYVKKMLPHKKHVEGKNGYEAIEGSDEEVNVGDTSHVCNGDVCIVIRPQHEEKATKESIRKGRAARIRAKIAKEVMKRRVRHKRTTTCPPIAALTENASTLDVQPFNESTSARKEIQLSEQSLVGMEPLLTTDEDTSCTMNTIIGGEKDMKKDSQVSENNKDDLDSSDEEYPFLVKHKNIEHLGRSATFHQSKELLDAMDVLSMNKDFFMKVLVDPESSLAQHFMVQHASGKRKYLDKSMTFPNPYPSKGEDLSSIALKPNGNSSPKENEKKSFKHLLVSPRVLDNLPKGEVACKRFKDLRQKLKHVIKESKEESHRIAMDSVLHKVPYGQMISESKKDVVDQLNLQMGDTENKDRKQNIVKRWPSLNESMERYCHLIETNLTRESDHNMSSDSLKLRVKDTNGCQPSGQRPWGSLGRISSSPDLLMCLKSSVADTYSLSPSRLPNGIPLPRRLMKASRSFNEFDIELMLSSFENSEIIDQVDEINGRDEITTPLRRVRDDENNVTQSPSMSIEEPSSTSIPESDSLDDSRSLEKSMIVSEDSSLSQQTGLFSLVKSTNVLEHQEVEPPSHQLKVDSKDQGHYDYVKDVLQLSGYLRNQPIDPSLFAKLEGCSLQEPDFLEYEESMRCNRLLLFDSINEVLLSTYERSMAYWNSPLTSCSQIHPMPKGYLVLEKVWSHISWYLNSAANQLESSLDHVIMHDIAEDNGWMNLQFEAEGAILEIENLIFEDLLMDAMFS